MEMDQKRFLQVAEKLKAISHPQRLCIVRGLIEKNGCNVSHMTECMDLPQSTISQHLGRLKAAGIVEGERKGVEISYRVVDAEIMQIIRLFFQ